MVVSWPSDGIRVRSVHDERDIGPRSILECARSGVGRRVHAELNIWRDAILMVLVMVSGAVSSIADGGDEEVRFSPSVE